MKVLIPVNEPSTEITHVQVYVDHRKDRKQVTASAFPAIYTNGIVTIPLVNYEFVTLAAMPRLNRKELERLQEATREAMDKRTDGPILGAVRKVAAEYGKTRTES